MKVWVDQRICVGNGICTELANNVFVMDDDSVAHVCEGGHVVPGAGPDAVAAVPAALEDLVVEAAQQCPVECIYVEDES